MSSTVVWHRIEGFCQRAVTRSLFTRTVTVAGQEPTISFSFDDFPRTALLNGGAILERFGVRATYYASLGLMGKTAPTGEMFVEEDLHAVMARGHELGCHTFAHCHSWDTKTNEFDRSVLHNQAALETLLPGASFKTFSYPISPPRPYTKLVVGRRFACARGGGQRFNRGKTDLNYLPAYFLEKSRHDPAAVKSVIERNRVERGWLVFATHDVCRTPTSYGCSPDFFEDVVERSVRSGARILPVAEALDFLIGHRGGRS